MRTQHRPFAALWDVTPARLMLLPALVLVPGLVQALVPVPVPTTPASQATIRRAALAADMAALSPAARTAAADPQPPDIAAAYNALSVGDAGTVVRLARWADRYGARQWTTGIAVTNVADRAADVQLELTDPTGAPVTGCGGACAVALAAGASHYWWPPDLPGMPDSAEQRTGGAIVRSTAPVVAVVHEAALVGASDGVPDSTAYCGFASDGPGTGARNRLVALALRAASLPPLGVGATALDVLNLDPAAPMSVGLDFRPAAGAPATAYSVVVPAGGAVHLRLADVPALADGAYSVEVDGGGPAAVVARTDWDAGRASVAVEGGVSAAELIVPFVTGAFLNRCTLLTVRNNDDRAAHTAQLAFYDGAGGSPAYLMPLTLAAGGTRTVTPCGDGGLATALGPNFLGSARIVADSGVTLSGQALLDEIGTPAVAAWQAVPTTSAASPLYAPLVHVAWPVRAVDTAPTAAAAPATDAAPTTDAALQPVADPVHPADTAPASASALPPATDPLPAADPAPASVTSSTLAVTNPGESTLSVAVTYIGLRGACQGARYSDGQHALASHGTLHLDPGGAGGLPAPCLAAARIEAIGGGVLAVVHDRGSTARPVTPVASLALPLVGR